MFNVSNLKLSWLGWRKQRMLKLFESTKRNVHSAQHQDPLINIPQESFWNDILCWYHVNEYRATWTTTGMKVREVSGVFPASLERIELCFHCRFFLILTSTKWTFSRNGVCILHSLIRNLAWRKLVTWSECFTASKLCAAACHRSQPRGLNGRQKLRREQDGWKELLTRKTATESMQLSTSFKRLSLNPNKITNWITVQSRYYLFRPFDFLVL